VGKLPHQTSSLFLCLFLVIFSLLFSPFHMNYKTAHIWYRIHANIFCIFHTESNQILILSWNSFPQFYTKCYCVKYRLSVPNFLRLTFVCGFCAPDLFLIRFFSSAAFPLLIHSCDIRMVAHCFSLFLDAIGTLGTGLISMRSFDSVYISIPSAAGETGFFLDLWTCLLWMLKVLVLPLCLE
jgi:hypothetical protein